MFSPRTFLSKPPPPRSHLTPLRCARVQIVTILDLIGGDSSSLTETCATVSGAKSGTFKTFVGCLLLAVSQIIMVAYWYK